MGSHDCRIDTNRPMATDTDEATSEAGQVQRDVTPRWMPIQDSPLGVKMDRLNEQRAQRNHSQSLKRLAERGGVSPREALALIMNQPWREYRDLTEEQAITWLFDCGAV